MATTGANLRCQDCHTITDHRVAGKGSDLRPTDTAIGMECTDCHGDVASDHPVAIENTSTGSPARRVTSRSTPRTRATAPPPKRLRSTGPGSTPTAPHRLSTRSWTRTTTSFPRYRFWNRLSDNYLLGDVAVMDLETGRYPTSRPLGDVADPDAKLYAFKYKTAQQPIVSSTGQLIALDTSVFFATGDRGAATEQGLVNMGLTPPSLTSGSRPTPSRCSITRSRHSPGPRVRRLPRPAPPRMDLQGELGYALKADESVVCFQCHGARRTSRSPSCTTSTSRTKV